MSEDTPYPQADGNRPPQFTLRTLFLVTAAVAGFLGFVQAWGWLRAIYCTVFGLPAILLLVREARTRQLLFPGLRGIAGCVFLACTVCIVFPAWPFRSVCIDLFSRHVFPEAWYQWPSRWSELHLFGLPLIWYDAVFLVNLAMFLAGLEVVLLVKRLPPAAGRFRLGPRTALLVVAALLFAAYVGYPYVRGWWTYRQLAGTPSAIVIEYSTRSGLGTPPAGFVVVADAKRIPPPEEADVVDLPRARPPQPVYLVSPDRMDRLLRLLHDAGFFEMDACLHPYGTFDGLWKELRVSAGTHGFSVASYSGTPRDEPFAAMLEQLERELTHLPPLR